LPFMMLYSVINYLVVVRIDSIGKC